MNWGISGNWLTLDGLVFIAIFFLWRINIKLGRMEEELINFHYTIAGVVDGEHHKTGKPYSFAVRNADTLP